MDPNPGFSGKGFSRIHVAKAPERSETKLKEAKRNLLISSGLRHMLRDLAGGMVDGQFNASARL